MRRQTLDPAPGTLVLWGRAGVLAVVALAVGALSHVAGGGQLPHPVVLVLLLAGSVPLASRFLAGRAPTGRLVLLVLAGQTLTHGLLSVLGGHRGGSVGEPRGSAASPVVPLPAGDSDRTGSLFQQYDATYGSATGPVAHAPSPLSWLGHQADHLVEEGPGMVLAHLAGAVVLGLFLAVGETSLWRLLLLLAAVAHVTRAGWRLLAAAAGARRGVGLARSRVRPFGPQLLTSQVLDRTALRRRGPPFVLAA